MLASKKALDNSAAFQAIPYSPNCLLSFSPLRKKKKKIVDSLKLKVLFPKKHHCGNIIQQIFTEHFMGSILC